MAPGSRCDLRGNELSDEHAARLRDRIDRIGSAPAPAPLVYIAGSERSGSTLLDLLLGNHSQVQSVGEVHLLSLYARTAVEPCTCGRPVSQCPFWTRVQSEGRRAMGLNDNQPLLQTLDTMLVPGDVWPVGTLFQGIGLFLGNRWLYRLARPLMGRPHLQAIRNSLFWYEIIRQTSGRRILVDSSKHARRLKLLYFADPARFRLIYLVRDGRAVAASKIRRGKLDMRRAARQWVSDNRRSVWAQRGIPDRQRMVVQYEMLCRRPEDVLRAICRFVGIPYEPAMLSLGKTNAHNIAGNPMRFRTDETRIQLDEQWRDQLSADDLEVFQRVAGRWNRRLGYDDETCR